MTTQRLTRETNSPNLHTLLPGVTLRTEDMPAEMQMLLNDYPRDAWPGHPGFAELTQGWLRAHQMFRRLSQTIVNDVQGFIDGRKDTKRFVSHLSYRGSALVGNLSGHHAWEDRSYFPELSAADARFDAGLRTLEADHAALDTVLRQFASTGNQVMEHVDNGDNKPSALGELHTLANAIEALLQRHLGDEEELAVPIILHHRLRG